MLKVQKSEVPTDKSDRRRGRPAGKNRKPLSLDERRARNAQYERERRNETADAMAQLAEAACCDAQISNAELLATVISQLQRRAKRKLPKDIEELKRANEDLESQIAALQTRLGPDDDFDEDSKYDCISDQQSDSSSNSEEEPQTQRGCNLQSIEAKPTLPDFQSTTGEAQRSRKIRKTSKSSSVSGAYKSESDTETDSDTNSDWPNMQTAPKQYQLRQRRQKVSEQSENTTTYRIPYESETSQNGIQVKRENQSEDSYQSDVDLTIVKHETLSAIQDSDQSDVDSTNVKIETLSAIQDSDQSDADSTNYKNETLSAIPEQDEYAEHYDPFHDDITDTTLLDKLTEDDKQIINEWLDSSETLNARSEQDNNKVKTFLDFDNFLLDINA